MESNIYVETGSITEQLSSFKEQMTQLETLFTRVDQEIKDTKEIWEGSASETTLAEIEKLKKLFDSIKSKNEKYSTFLDTVIEKYTEEDEEEINTVDSNEKAFNTGFEG